LDSQPTNRFKKKGGGEDGKPEEGRPFVILAAEAQPGELGILCGEAGGDGGAETLVDDFVLQHGSEGDVVFRIGYLLGAYLP